MKSENLELRSRVNLVPTKAERIKTDLRVDEALDIARRRAHGIIELDFLEQKRKALEKRNGEGEQFARFGKFKEE